MTFTNFILGYVGNLLATLTGLAISLAIAAAESGRRVYYGTLGDLIASLEDAQTAGHLTQRLKTL